MRRTCKCLHFVRFCLLGTICQCACHWNRLIQKKKLRTASLSNKSSALRFRSPSLFLSLRLSQSLTLFDLFPSLDLSPPPSLPISSLSPFLLLSALFTAKSENTLSLGGFLPFLHASDLYLEISFCPSVYLSSSFPSVRSLFFVLCSLKLSIDVLILILTFNLFIFHYYYRFERNSACGREAVLI